MKIPYLLLIIMMFLSGCKDSSKSIRKKLPGTWRLYDIVSAVDKAPISFEQEARFKKIAGRGYLFNFFEDGTYTELPDTVFFGHGTYQLSAGNIMQLNDGSGKANREISLMQEDEENGKQLFSFRYRDKDYRCRFIKEAEPLKIFPDDPFYPENNKWRIKPGHPEDTAQLKARMANYFRHIALILKAATERKQTVVSFNYSLGPLKIYDGGIGIHPYSIVPDSWKHCFFNEADAEKAYQIYELYLERSSSYEGATTGNWFVDDYNIVLSIYADFAKEKK